MSNVLHSFQYRHISVITSKANILTEKVDKYINIHQFSILNRLVDMGN